MERELNSLYIHVPYCKNKCNYCQYDNIAYSEKNIRNYINNIIIPSLKKLKDKTFYDVYFGGGTAGLIPLDLMKVVFQLLDKMNISVRCWESTPEELTNEKINILKKYNFDYVSMGIQSFDSRICKLNNRNFISIEKVKTIINTLQDHSLMQNIDLIYGLENKELSDPKIFLRDLTLIEKLKPTFVTVHIDYNIKNQLLMRQKLLPVLQEWEGSNFTCINNSLKEDFSSLMFDATNRAEYKFASSNHSFMFRQIDSHPFTPNHKWKITNIEKDGINILTNLNDSFALTQTKKDAYSKTKECRNILGLKYF